LSNEVVHRRERNRQNADDAEYQLDENPRSQASIITPGTLQQRFECGLADVPEFRQDKGVSIRKFLGLSEPATAETETVRRVVESLDNLPEDRARYIAAFGYILGRVADADLNISEKETRAMEEIVAQQGNLPAEQAVIVVQLAKTHNQLFGATENFLVTREFARMSTREERLALLDCLFAVSAAEDDISMTENNEIRQIASELGLEHREFIQVRSAWKDRLGVFKDLPARPGQRLNNGTEE
jgi:uncharacterized tellurite resistance protein B-like protein